MPLKKIIIIKQYTLFSNNQDHLTPKANDPFHLPRLLYLTQKTAPGRMTFVKTGGSLSSSFKSASVKLWTGVYFILHSIQLYTTFNQVSHTWKLITVAGGKPRVSSTVSCNKIRVTLNMEVVKEKERAGLVLHRIALLIRWRPSQPQINHCSIWLSTRKIHLNIQKYHKIIRNGNILYMQVLPLRLSKQIKFH